MAKFTTQKSYSGKDVAASTLTRLVVSTPEGDIYSHSIQSMFGEFVVVRPVQESTNTRDWEAAETLAQAERILSFR